MTIRKSAKKIILRPARPTPQNDSAKVILDTINGVGPQNIDEIVLELQEVRTPDEKFAAAMLEVVKISREYGCKLTLRNIPDWITDLLSGF